MFQEIGLKIHTSKTKTMIINWNLISDIIYSETIIEIHNVELIYTRD